MSDRDLEQAEVEWRQQKEEARLIRPVRSDIRDRTASSRYWCALLDGRPVAHCSAFDTAEGWVEVYVIIERRENRSFRGMSQVRLYGAVEAIWHDDFHELSKHRPPIEVFAVPVVEAAQ